MEGKAAEAIIQTEESFTPVVAADATRASEEQSRYGQVLSVLMRIGLGLIAITFVAYLIGTPTPHIAIGDVSQFWDLKVNKYLEATGIQSGWAWASKLGQGDFLNFVPIAMMASITAVCYASIVPMFLKKKDFIYAGLALAEILVLVLAASGVLPAEAM